MAKKILKSMIIPTTVAGEWGSPIVDHHAVMEDRRRIWPEKPSDPLGVDFNIDEQLSILQEDFPKYIDGFDFAKEEGGKGQYFLDNPFFAHLDARTLFVFINKYKPERIIEVGSGYSTALMAETIVKAKLDCSILSVESSPSDFLYDVVSNHDFIELAPVPVQKIGYEVFESLTENDFLFIDSSHVSKTGGDVNYLYLEILPRLNSGVKIHAHDIFMPQDYPEVWVLNEMRSWNEQYLIQALLSYSTAYKVLFAVNYLAQRRADQIKAVFDGHLYGGGSLWLEKV